MPPEVSQHENREASRKTLRQRLARLTGNVRGAVAWGVANWVKAGLLAAVCLTFTGVAVGLWFALSAVGTAAEKAMVRQMLEALDAGEIFQARELAKSIRGQKDRPLDALAAAAFVAGAGAAYEAEEIWSSEKKNYYLVAARYLEEARDRGFPVDRASDGTFLLGKSLVLSDQFPESRPVLKEALELNPHRATEIQQLLAVAYLYDANPKYALALQHNANHLDDRMLPAGQRHEGLAQRAHILLRLGRLSEATSALDEIPQGARNEADAIVLRGQVLMQEARLLEEAPEKTPGSQAGAAPKYRQAIEILSLAEGRDTLSRQAGRKAMYLIGICFVKLGDDRQALEKFNDTRLLHKETPEATAATFETAELSRRLGDDSQAFDAYRKVLKDVKDPMRFSNAWITLDDLRERMLAAYRYYFKAEKFDISLQIAWLFAPLFSPEQQTMVTGETYRAWGDSLLSQAGLLPPVKAELLARQGREHLRRAGKAYERLAKLRITRPEYLDDLWKSAENYQQGQDYTHAAEILEEYLKYESRPRRPRALVRLGESRLALGQLDEALAAFEECIEFHFRDAASFRARLAASRAQLEKGQFEEAQKLLEQNLDHEYLEPSSPEWRDSLFSLGRLLHAQGRYEEASARLEDAVQRYPQTPQATEGLYLVADCFRRSAVLKQAELEKDLVEQKRAGLVKQIVDLRNRALERFQAAQAALLRREKENNGLPPLDESILRNCFFAIGDVHFDLRRYEDARMAYQGAASRYQDSPEVLNAYVQIYRAYRQLDDLDRAQGALAQAEVRLNRLEDAGKFTGTTIFGPQEWADRLGRLKLLAAAGK